jgi:hypothetical protein
MTLPVRLGVTAMTLPPVSPEEDLHVLAWQNVEVVSSDRNRFEGRTLVVPSLRCAVIDLDRKGGLGRGIQRDTVSSRVDS